MLIWQEMSNLIDGKTLMKNIRNNQKNIDFW